MKKIICDACGVEGANNQFAYLCHLDHPHDVRVYADNDGNPVSGRTVTADLCNKCYNTIVGPAVMMLNARRAIPHG